MRRIGVALAAVVALLAGVQPAQAAGAVYSGTGWRIATAAGIRSLDPTSPYLFTFASAGARSRLTPYLTPVASQLTSVTGIRFTVSATVEVIPTGKCPPRHHIVMGLKYRPTGNPGMSQALPCRHSTNYSAWGGIVWIDSEYWGTSWAITEAQRRNAVAHEVGHIAGLAHPNYDRDKDGRVESYECVRTTAGVRPLLCSPNGGYQTTTSSGRFVTEYEVPGLRQLVRNWAYRPAGT